MPLYTVLVESAPDRDRQIKRSGLAIFSSLCYCTAELLLSRGRPSSVVRPSVKPIFSEPVGHINAKFGGKVPLHHISRPFFYFSKFCIFDFLRIFSVFVNMGPFGRKNFNRLLL